MPGGAFRDSDDVCCLMNVQFLLGKRVRYRGRVGTVVRHDAHTEVFIKEVVISFPETTDEPAEEVTVPAYLWPLIRVVDDQDRRDSL